MDARSKLYCVWADSGLALHNSGRTLLCCHSRKYLRDHGGKDIYLHSHDLAESLTSPTRREIQQALDQGIQHPNCQACWDEESANKESRRLSANRMNANIDTTGSKPRLLDLKLGNTCNLACRHCWPEVSSKWVRDFYDVEVRDSGQSYTDYLRRWDSIQLSYDRDNDRLWSRLREYIDDALYIDVYGAEPMLLHRLWEVLSYSVVQKHSLRQKIHVNTNGTIWNPDYIKILEQFAHARIDLSIDGLGQHFDYIRYGETWSVMQENLTRYMAWARSHPNVEAGVCITVFALNVWYLPDLCSFFTKQGIGYYFNFLHLPDYLCVKALPGPVRQAVQARLEKSVLTGAIRSSDVRIINDYMKDGWDDVPVVWRKFCQTTDQLDQLRSQSFQTCFPEFWEIVKEHWQT